MRILCLSAAAIVVLLAGCGSEEDPPRAASPREAFELFVTAVKEGDPEGAELVSARLPERHRAAFLREMRGDVAPISSGYRIVVDDEIDDTTAVVAAVGGDPAGEPPGGFGAVLLREGAGWAVAPPQLDLIYGVSAASGTTSTQKPIVGFEVNTDSPASRIEGRLWVDGRDVAVEKQENALTVEFAGRLERLAPGRHSAVAFARAGDRAAALAWTFRAD